MSASVAGEAIGFLKGHPHRCHASPALPHAPLARSSEETWLGFGRVSRRAHKRLLAKRRPHGTIVRVATQGTKEARPAVVTQQVSAEAQKGCQP
jgi:hypothetical protein